MSNRILTALMVASLVAVALPNSAEAGRKVRLMYEPPAATTGGPAVAVTFEDAREEKKGGKEPNLIAQERNQYGMPSGIFSGGSGTADPPEVVPAWVADVLRSAGYDARIGEDAALPRVHVKLLAVWGDGQPIMGIERHNFTLSTEISVYPVGATEPAYSVPVTATSGVTTVIMRFNDKFEAGFVRLFGEGTKILAIAIGTEQFQAAIPGGNPAAAADAAENLGKKAKDADKAVVQAGSGGMGEKAEAPNRTAEDNPAPCKSWDPDVAYWGCKPSIINLVLGGVGVGLLIGGDQWARSLAEARLGTDLPTVMSTLNSVDHLPPSANPDAEALDVVQGYGSELLFLWGMQFVVPSFGVGIPGIVMGAAGADIQTMKAAGGILSAPTMIPTGVAHIVRFANYYVPAFERNQDPAFEDRVWHVPMGVASLAAGIADITVGTIHLVGGILYATGTWEASAEDPGIMPPLAGSERNLKNRSALMVPYVAPNDRGGVSFGLVGTW